MSLINKLPTLHKALAISCLGNIAFLGKRAGLGPLDNKNELSSVGFRPLPHRAWDAMASSLSFTSCFWGMLRRPEGEVGGQIVDGLYIRVKPVEYV